jgi:hypothetical protein
MNRSIIKTVFLVLLLAALVAACDDEPRSLQTETKTVASGGAKSVEVDLRMGAGELRLTGSAQEALLEATFRYNRERLRPEVDYRISGETGVLRVGARRHSGVNFGRIRNDWDLRLGKSLPVELTLNLGAGQSRLDLRGLDLSGVDIDMGVGEMTMDISGPHARSFRVRVNGGIGSATVYLPADVGVRARVHGGLGSIRARGLSKDGKLYTNDAYGKSPVTIDLEIDGGIGSIDLRVEPGDRTKI